MNFENTAEGITEGVPVTIALEDGHGSFSLGNTRLRGWFDVEAGTFVIPFVSADIFAATMITLINVMADIEEESHQYWQHDGPDE